MGMASAPSSVEQQPQSAATPPTIDMTMETIDMVFWGGGAAGCP